MIEQVRISSDAVEVVVLPDVGARLHRLRAFGHELLRTPVDVGAHERDPFFWGAFVMAPWCNRIDARSEGFGGRRVALEPNFADGSAIHGQVYARRWDQEEDGLFRVRAGGDGWPWEYEVSLCIGTTSRTLWMEHRLTNLSDAPMPGGLGIHPWFVAPLLVAIRAEIVYASNTSTTSQPEPVRGHHDLRRIVTMPTDLDATWAGLTAAPVELRWPKLGVRAAMLVTSPSTHIVAASPATLDAVAVEPQTHAPQGLRRLVNGEPGALSVLEPGNSLELRVEFTFERLAGD